MKIRLENIPFIFRPVKILEAFAPPSGAKPDWRERTSRLLRILRLGAANLWWLARWRVRRLRGQD